MTKAEQELVEATIDGDAARIASAKAAVLEERGPQTPEKTFIKKVRELLKNNHGTYGLGGVTFSYHIDFRGMVESALKEYDYEIKNCNDWKNPF